MLRTTRLGKAGIVLLLALSLVAAVVAAGCSGGGTTTSTSTVRSEDLNAPKDWTTGPTAPSTTSTTAKPASQTDTTGTTVIYQGKTKEQYEKALPGLVEKSKASPNDLAVLLELAVAQYNTDRFADAAVTYQKMLAIKKDAVTTNNYANVLRDWGKIADAKKQYAQAYTLNPTLTTAYVNLAALWVKENKLAEANKVLDLGISKTTGEAQKSLKDYKTELNKPKQ